jgi:hypothetical protein
MHARKSILYHLNIVDPENDKDEIRKDELE